MARVRYVRVALISLNSLFQRPVQKYWLWLDSFYFFSRHNIISILKDFQLLRSFDGPTAMWHHFGARLLHYKNCKSRLDPIGAHGCE